MRRVIGFAKPFRRPGQDAQVIYDKGIGYGTIVLRHVGNILPGAEPVAQIRCDPEVFNALSASHMPDLTIHMGFHAVVLLSQIAVCSILAVKHFRDDSHCIAPAEHIDKTDSARTFRRNDRSNISFRIILLTASHIPEVLCPEFFCIIVICSRKGKYLTITGIPHTFISLGAVCGNFYIVRLLSPDLVLIETVSKGVGTGKMTGAVHIAVYSICSDQSGRIFCT